MMHMHPLVQGVGVMVGSVAEMRCWISGVVDQTVGVDAYDEEVRQQTL